MKVTVFHKDIETSQFVAVAEIDASHCDRINQALEYAWRWTNNTHGSWSVKQETFDVEGEVFDNVDFNPNLTVLLPLEIGPDGTEWGHRSSMMGDRFVVSGGDVAEPTPYRVAMIGFEADMSV